MLAIISPAKTLDFVSPLATEKFTLPDFAKESQELIKTLRKYDPAAISNLMGISDKLAALNHERYRQWHADPDADAARPAILAFKGDVYMGLDAQSMQARDFTWAQKHLRVLSGLHGLLKPLDRIQPYRLEMGTKLKTKRGKSLYEFWNTKLAEQLREDLNGHHDHTIVNLASNEYFKAVDKETLDKPVMEAKFLNIKDGKTRNLMYYAKFGRGLMARWILQNRIDKANDLKNFDVENYKFDKSLSSEKELVFTRPQPPKKS